MRWRGWQKFHEFFIFHSKKRASKGRRSGQRSGCHFLVLPPWVLRSTLMRIPRTTAHLRNLTLSIALGTLRSKWRTVIQSGAFLFQYRSSIQKSLACRCVLHAFSMGERIYVKIGVKYDGFPNSIRKICLCVRTHSDIFQFVYQPYQQQGISVFPGLRPQSLKV